MAGVAVSNVAAVLVFLGPQFILREVPQKP